MRARQFGPPPPFGTLLAVVDSLDSRQSLEARISGGGDLHQHPARWAEGRPIFLRQSQIYFGIHARAPARCRVDRLRPGYLHSQVSPDRLPLVSKQTPNLSNHIPVCAAETPLRRYLCWFFLLAFAVPRTVPGVIAALLLIIKVKLCLRDTSPKICHTYLKSKQK